MASETPAEGAKNVGICKACHTFEKGGPNRIGPNLYGVVDRKIASEAGFNYSPALKGKEGDWTYDKLDAWLTDPRAWAPGTRMIYAGMKDEKKARGRRLVPALARRHSGASAAAQGLRSGGFRVASLDELAHFAHRLADLAAVVQRRYFRQPVAVDTKADQSPVTIADREAEARMRDLIRSVYPAHGILGEEHGADALDAELVWVLDPIDGTKSFIAGRPLFGTLVGLLEAGRPVLGIIDQSILHERWVGVSGRQTTLNGAPVGARPCAGLADAVLMTTSPLQFHGDDRRAFDRLTDAVRQASFGGDCYAYALVATGFVDLVVEAGLKPYDFAAIIPVIEGAGGQLTDWEGGALGLGSDGRVIASGDARTHEAARRLLAGAA